MQLVIAFLIFITAAPHNNSIVIAFWLIIYLGLTHLFICRFADPDELTYLNRVQIIFKGGLITNDEYSELNNDYKIYQKMKLGVAINSNKTLRQFKNQISTIGDNYEDPSPLIELNKFFKSGLIEESEYNILRKRFLGLGSYEELVSRYSDTLEVALRNLFGEDMISVKSREKLYKYRSEFERGILEKSEYDELRRVALKI